RQDQGQGLPHLLVVGQRPPLAPLVAPRELHTVVPVVQSASREHPVIVAGTMSPAHTEGGLRQMRAGSARPNNPRGSDNAGRSRLSSLADNPSSLHTSLSNDAAFSSALAENSPEVRELGLYVHVPFCAKRCGYCSFNTAPLEDGAMARYLVAFHREIELLAGLAWAPRVRLSTIFLPR